MNGLQPLPNAIAVPTIGNLNPTTNPNVVAAQNNLNGLNNSLTGATNTYNALNSGAGNVGNALRGAIESKWNNNQDIISQMGNSLNNLLAAGNQQNTPINGNFLGSNTNLNAINPTAATNFNKNNFDNASVNYQNWQQLYNNRLGTLNQILKAGQGAYNSEVSAAQGAQQGALQGVNQGNIGYNQALTGAQNSIANQLANQGNIVNYNNALTNAIGYQNNAQISGNAMKDAAQIGANASIYNNNNNLAAYGAGTANTNPATSIQALDNVFSSNPAYVAGNPYAQQNMLYQYLTNPTTGGGLSPAVKAQAWKQWNTLDQAYKDHKVLPAIQALNNYNPAQYQPSFFQSLGAGANSVVGGINSVINPINNLLHIPASW